MKHGDFALIGRETKKLLKDPNFVAFEFIQSKLGIDKKNLTEAIRTLQKNLVNHTNKVALNFPKTDLEHIIIYAKQCYAAIRPDKDYHSNKLFVTIYNYEPYDDNESLLPSPHQYTIEANTVDEFYHGLIRVSNILTFNSYAVVAKAELAETIDEVTRPDSDEPILKKGIV